MDFQNVNLFNVRLNKFSGNLLPMAGDESVFPVAWRIYSVVIWLIEVIQTTAIIPGVLSVPIDIILQNGMISILITIEVSVLLMQINVHRDLASQLSRKLNKILRSNSEDETMNIIVKSTLKTVEIPLKFYFTAGIGSLILWCCVSFVVIFEKKFFLYEDYRIPIVLSKQPFSTEMFLLGNCIISIASIYLFTKKIAANVYMINLVLLVTAQYRYIAVKLTTIFQENVPQKQRNESEEEYSTVNSLAILQMKGLCRYHNDVVQLTLMLRKLLSLNMSFLYLTNIFILCFLNVMLISAILSSDFIEALTLLIYEFGQLLQLYILCFCLNQLLNASVEITDKAFHEKWYLFGSSLKHMYRMLIITNNLECKVSSSEIFNLSLPSFMSILNQSYSFALVFLRIM